MLSAFMGFVEEGDEVHIYIPFVSEWIVGYLLIWGEHG